MNKPVIKHSPTASSRHHHNCLQPSKLISFNPAIFRLSRHFIRGLLGFSIVSAQIPLLLTTARPARANSDLCATPGKDGVVNVSNVVNTYFVGGAPGEVASPGQKTLMLPGSNANGASTPINPGAIAEDNITYEIEYTVYFLSNGGTPVEGVKLCDAIPDNTTFVKNTYGVELGIGLGLDNNSLPTISNIKLSNLLNDDRGDFYASGKTPPPFCQKNDPQNPQNLIPVNASNNDAGAVVVELDSSLPYATDPGIPANSYGFIRFRAKVK